jgi:hypothetical protein
MAATGWTSSNGGAGQDTFLFEAASAYNNVDVVKNFSTGESDKLDLADLLTGYNPVTDAITDFVEITDNSGNIIMKVDADGTGGGASFVQIATLEGITGLTDEAALETAGTLITV